LRTARSFLSHLVNARSLAGAPGFVIEPAGKTDRDSFLQKPLVRDFNVLQIKKSRFRTFSATPFPGVDSMGNGGLCGLHATEPFTAFC
jgi:hypothetical protein